MSFKSLTMTLKMAFEAMMCKMLHVKGRRMQRLNIKEDKSFFYAMLQWNAKIIYTFFLYLGTNWCYATVT